MIKPVRILGFIPALFLAFIWSPHAIAATQTASPATCTNVTGIGTQTWSNPGNAISSNNGYATGSVNDNQTTNYLKCVGYGFSIPAGATINGITVSVERNSSNTNATQDAAMQLVKAGVVQATDRSTNTYYPTADTYEDHGSSTDLWGASWAPADINNTNFGAAFASVKPTTSGGGRTVSVDHIQITVDYTPLSSPTVTTNAATALTTTGATLNGTVSSNGASTAVTFDYGLTAGYGSSVTATGSPLAAGARATAVSAAIAGLSCNTLYHFWVKGVNSVGTTNGSDLTFTTLACPSVTSINTVSSNPTAPATAVAWTVVFSVSVTGVDATDFTLVPAGGVTGATITSVTGSGTTWTVNANTGTGTGTLGLNLVDDDSIAGGGLKLGGTGAGNGNFTGQVYTVPAPFCSPPSNIPAGVTVSCVCDQFGRTNLNPSTIFGGNWTLSHGTTDAAGTNPYINATTGLLRLTENTGNNAKAATVPSIFPAAGNYISVEFNNYAYQGGNTGADGIAVTLSDYTIPAAPGGFGGSLGYAQRTDSTPNPPGFAGGWVGIALDEYGNFQNPTEGRIGGPGARAQSVGVRGPGSGTNGYRYMGGTASSPGGYNISANSTSSTPATGYMYQVIVDARNSTTGNINLSVNRDVTTKDGTNYSSVFGPFNAYTEANYALSQGWISQLVPDYWKISFTGSTGGSINVHEIGSLRICAQTVLPSTGGTASGFSAIDEAYTGSPVPAYSNFQTGDIYTKLVGTPFKLWVAALGSTAISTGYSATSNKYVQVKFVDNTDNACGLIGARTCNSTCTGKSGVESSATQIATFPSGSSTGVASPSPSFTLNSAYKNLVAIMKECTTSTCAAFTAIAPACSADSFSVRPLSSTVASIETPAGISPTNAANNSGTSGSPTFKAGGQNFNLTATTSNVSGNPIGYNGIMKINSAAVLPGPGAVAGILTGTFNPATYPAISPYGSSTSVGNGFTYSEVGGFTLPVNSVYEGVVTSNDCAAITATVCDTNIKAPTWTGVDSPSTTGDCVADSFSNVKNAAGKYGCNFGNSAAAGPFGRFVPDHFAVTSTFITNRADFAVTGSIATGSGVLTLSTAASVMDGDTISIAGAGVAGATFASTATAVSADGLTVTLASAATSTVTNAPVNVSMFTYMGEPMNVMFTLTAQSAGNTTTKNYTGTLAKLNPLSGPFGLGMVNVAATRTPFSVCTGTPADPCFTLSSVSAGTTFNNGVAAGITVPLTVYRGASAVGPYANLNIGIAPVDSDGVTTVYDLDTVNVIAGTNNHTIVGNTGVRYGRMNISNAHGSELLQLPIPIIAQYWNGSSFVTNTNDNLTALDATTVNASDWTNLTPGNWLKLSSTSTWAAGSTSVAPATASVAFINGTASFKLTAPGTGKTGSVDLRINSPTYLPSNSGNPVRATFGVYKGANEFIYLRENY